MKTDPPPTKLEDFASVVELRALRAVAEHGSARKAAKVLGIHHASVSRAIERVKRRAARQGFAPEVGWNQSVPDPHYASGVSTLYGSAGEVKLQWVKSKQDADEARALLWREWREEFAAPCRGLGRLPKQQRTHSDRLCNEFIIGDPHIGMFALAEETLGDNWDLHEAEQVHVEVMRRLVADAPAAAVANIIFLGDTTHADNFSATTERGGNRLDVDSRFPKMVRVALRTIRTMVHLGAQNHERTILHIIPGNHDPQLAVQLAESFAMFYEGDSRIEVDNTASPDKFFQWGKTLSMYTHGNRMKPARMQAKLSRHPAWSETTYHEVKQGHIHHSMRQDIGNASLEAFEVVPPADAWHAAEGYASGRSMTRITYDLDHGEIGRGRVPVSMVRS